MPMPTREAQNEYNRRWVAERRRKWFAENGPCVECGSWENLELDHINPLVKWKHSIWSLSEENRQRELDKCQVMCHACHAKKTKADRAPAFIHGLYSTYNYWKCRCTECRKANADRRFMQRYS